MTVEVEVTTPAGVPIPADSPVEAALIAARKAATELLEMGAEACNASAHDSFTKRFWEIVRDEATKIVGQPPRLEKAKIKPMEAKTAREFAKDEMPRGKYVDQKVASVFQKDPEYLRDFATRLDFWQLDLQSWIAWAETQTISAPETAKTPAMKESVKPDGYAATPTTPTPAAATAVAQAPTEKKKGKAK